MVTAIVNGRLELIKLRIDKSRVDVNDTEMLEDLGHRVIGASSGAHALDIIRSGQQIDLMVTDHVMPGMTGPELAALLRERYPGLRVLYTSGYAPAVVGPQASIDVDNLLQKPFTRDTLLAAIQRAST